MDRAGFWARTDNIVVVDPSSRRLLWVPRDLWCDCLGTRIASAFAMGGHAALREALAEHALVVEHGICLARPFVERCLALAEVTVPVEEPLAFLYPLAPNRPIEDGSKIVRFEPPEERLRGERIHQWLGARTAVGRPSGDLERIRRQQIFLRRWLAEPIALPPDSRRGKDYRWTGASAFEEIRAVAADWTVETFEDLEPTQVNGASVLKNRRRVAASRRLTFGTTLVVATRALPRRTLGVWARLRRLAFPLR